MKFYAVNGSPRKNWNTATLLGHALEGIKAVVPEADCERIDLYASAVLPASGSVGRALENVRKRMRSQK